MLLHPCWLKICVWIKIIHKRIVLASLCERLEAMVIILYINMLRGGPWHTSAGYSLRPTCTSSLSIDAVCISDCYKVLSDPIWWQWSPTFTDFKFIVTSWPSPFSSLPNFFEAHFGMYVCKWGKPPRQPITAFACTKAPPGGQIWYCLKLK